MLRSVNPPGPAIPGISQAILIESGWRQPQSRPFMA